MLCAPAADGDQRRPKISKTQESNNTRSSLGREDEEAVLPHVLRLESLGEIPDGLVREVDHWTKKASRALLVSETAKRGHIEKMSRHLTRVVDAAVVRGLVVLKMVELVVEDLRDLQRRATSPSSGR